MLVTNLMSRNYELFTLNDGTRTHKMQDNFVESSVPFEKRIGSSAPRDVTTRSSSTMDQKRAIKSNEKSAKRLGLH